MGRSPGGLTTKIHALVDANGRKHLAKAAVVGVVGGGTVPVALGLPRRLRWCHDAPPRE